MDILSVVGVILAFVAILGGNMLEGGNLSSLLQLTAFVVVFGGTVGAILIQSPLPTFLKGLKMTRWVVLPPKTDPAGTIERIVEWCQLARKEGLLGLETLSEEESDPFARKGLQLLVDGSEPEVIRNTLETELDAIEARDIKASKIFEAAGGYSPTIGILGAVMGLIHVMQHLSDPSKLGEGIATAFVATIYGVGLANLFFLPISGKLRSVVENQSRVKEIIIEGVIAIAEGENPRAVDTKLQGYVQ